MAMRKFEVPITKEMIECLNDGETVVWKVDNITFSMCPTFVKEDDGGSKRKESRKAVEPGQFSVNEGEYPGGASEGN